MVTGPRNDVDFVSKFFAPSSGIYEDPVTGPPHCSLIPYWNKNTFTAKQVSKIRGYLKCELIGDCVKNVFFNDLDTYNYKQKSRLLLVGSF
jgi:hypothetical protein